MAQLIRQQLVGMDVENQLFGIERRSISEGSCGAIGKLKSCTNHRGFRAKWFVQKCRVGTFPDTFWQIAMFIRSYCNVR